MKKKKAYRILTILTLAFAFASANAQQVSPVDFMRLNPYQINANPATDLPYQSVMSLVIGNIDLNVQNTTLRYDNLFIARWITARGIVSFSFSTGGSPLLYE